MSSEPDPRFYFAAERTLLAWIRTSLAVMGLGFVVARFGLFLRMVATATADQNLPPPSPSRGLVSTTIGVALVVLAALMTGISGVQFQRFLKTLGPMERPRHYSPILGIAVSITITICGFVLAVSLLIWTH